MTLLTKKSSNQKKAVSMMVWFAYIVIFFEILYMASPFAIFFYSVYKPPLDLLNSSNLTSWLVQSILPHFVETDSLLITGILYMGWPLMIIGLLVFIIGFIQIYWGKFTKKGATTTGLYKYIRHPQYFAWAVFGLGMCIVWSRMIVWIMYITMLFVYYFLARSEERECLEKYESYKSYYEKTGMFFFKLNQERPSWLSLPKGKTKRVLAASLIYIFAIGLTIGLGFFFKNITISNFSSVSGKNYLALSVVNMDKNQISRLLNISNSDPEVKKRLQNLYQEHPKQLIYILPYCWDAGELGIEDETREECKRGGFNFVTNPTSHGNSASYDKNKYKLVYSHAITFEDVQGESILFYIQKKVPKLVVYVNLENRDVNEIKIPPKEGRFKDVPVPFY